MSSDVVISVSGLSKCYQIYEKPHHRLLQMLLGRFREHRFYREFWALRDITFEVGKGKVVGILGKNGAGKSTLLQILCGTLSSSAGRITINGRVAALLELGAGFNPEFTGVENVYMNGQILGLSRSEIEQKIDDIRKFADIGDFFLQPVKTYSSGMFARLAFSVAVHVDPDVLIVDEALSVGDSWFQHKSMARMRALMSKGCTVLFVSHSIDAVRALCDEAIWLDQGKVKMQGGVTDVTNAYMNDVFIEHNRIVLQSMEGSRDTTVMDKGLFTPSLQEAMEATGTSAAATAAAIAELDGGNVFTVRSKQLKNSRGSRTDRLDQGEAFSLEFELEFHDSINNVSLGFLIKDQFGQELTGESYFNSFRKGLNFDAGEVVRFVFKSIMDFRGGESYSVSMFVNQVSKWDRSDNVVIFADHLALVFDVLADKDNPMWFKYRQKFDVAVFSEHGNG